MPLDERAIAENNRENRERVHYFVHSLVATTQISKRLKYVLDWTYNHSQIGVGATRANTDIYGLNNEIIYQYNSKWAFGTRFGMLHGLNTIDETLDWVDAKTDWYNVSLGANWTPNKWLIVKPEIRYDWTDKPAAGVFGSDGTAPNKSYQFSGGLSTVVKF